jgi:hypothetical protein
LNHLYSWNRDKFLSFTGAQAEYFNIIEKHLNIAILQTAYAINLAISFFQDCDCGGEPKPELEELHDIMQLHANEQMIFIIMGSASLLCSLYVISLVMTQKIK